MLHFYTSPFVHRKYMNGRLRRPAAAVRHAAVRHAACLRRREESNDRCYVSLLTLLIATASGRVATPISSAPVRRTLQTTEVPCVEAPTSTTMSRARRQPAAACGGDHLTIVEARRERSSGSCHPWSVAKRCLANTVKANFFSSLPLAMMLLTTLPLATLPPSTFHDAAHQTADVTRSLPTAMARRQ